MFRIHSDLIDKKNTFLTAGLFDFLIDRGDNFTHRIFCHRVFFSLIIFLNDHRQTDSTLAGMVCDRIGNQTDVTFIGCLLHNSGFADAGRTDQQDRTLADSRHEITSVCILACIDLYCMKKFKFCFFDIHKKL